MSLLVKTKTARQLWVVHTEPQRGSSKNLSEMSQLTLFIHRLWAQHGKNAWRKMNLSELKSAELSCWLWMNFENILVQTDEWRFVSFVYVGNELDRNVWIGGMSRWTACSTQRQLQWAALWPLLQNKWVWNSQHGLKGSLAAVRLRLLHADRLIHGLHLATENI